MKQILCTIYKTSALCPYRENVDNLVTNYGLTINIKDVSQHATNWKILFADKIVVLTIDLAEK